MHAIYFANNSLYYIQHICFEVFEDICLNHVGVEFRKLWNSDVNYKQHSQSENLFNITSTIIELPDAQTNFLRMHATSMESQSNTPLNAFQSYITSKTLIHVESSFLEPLAGSPSLTWCLFESLPTTTMLLSFLLMCFRALSEISLASYPYWTHLKVHVKDADCRPAGFTCDLLAMEWRIRRGGYDG